MSKSPNLYSFDSPPSISTFLFPSLDSISSKSKPQLSKPSKLPQSSLRAGDWICLLCNNLNFSFRNECNRCQRQTKKQNYMQNLMLISQENELNDTPMVNNTKEYKESQPKRRKPLGDLTNCYQNEEINWQTKKKGNYGFENVLLLTPPKSLVQNQNFNRNENYVSDIMLNFNSPNSATYKKLIKPYQSPKQIPSISPILKSDFLIRNSKEKQNKYEINKKMFEMINEENQEDETTVKNDLNFKNFERKPKNMMHLLEETTNYEENNKSNVNEFDDILKQIIDEDNTVSFQSKEFIDFSEKNQYMNIPKENNLLNSLINGLNNYNSFKNEKKKIKGKEEYEKKSDWICIHCKNLNYSFRVFCNRCQIPKQ